MNAGALCQKWRELFCYRFCGSRGSGSFCLLEFMPEGVLSWGQAGLNNQFFVNKTTQAVFTCIYADFRVLSMGVRNKQNR